MFWASAPFLKGPGNFFGTNGKRRGDGRRKMNLRDSENFIHKSIHEEPANFENRLSFDAI